MCVCVFVESILVENEINEKKNEFICTGEMAKVENQMGVYSIRARLTQSNIRSGNKTKANTKPLNLKRKKNGKKKT